MSARIQRASDWHNARWCQIPPAAATDLRLSLVHFRVLAYLGRVGKANGWCEFSQKAAAELFNCSRQSINTAVRDLVEWKYLLKRGQDETKSSACQYKVLLERDDEDGGVSSTLDTPPDETSKAQAAPVSSTGDTRVAIKDTLLEPRTKNQVIPLPPSGASPKGDRGSRLPDDFVVPDEWRQWAAEKAPRFTAMIDHEAEKFTDHWRAATGAKARKRDWAGTWRNWWRTAVERAPRNFGLLQTPKDRANQEFYDLVRSAAPGALL